MNYRIPVYRAEVEAGVADEVRSRASVAYLVPAEPVEAGSEAALTLQTAAANSRERACAAQDEGDLFFMKDVLATVGKNRNDDVLTKGEAWAARHTNEDKPLNFEHDRTDVIGHVVSSYAVADDFAPIGDSATVDELPDKFHLVNGTVIYRILSPKTPEEEARAALIEDTIQEIKAGEWFVSMECFFRGFDYALEDSEGNQHIVPRNESTAWLTGHLRAYAPAKRADWKPGMHTGKFTDKATGKEYSVGRVYRNVTYSGKGLVRTPANPESVIFNSVASFSPSPLDPVYLKAGTEASPCTTEERREMSEPNAELVTLKAQLADAAEALKAARTEVESLKAADTEAKISGLEADLTAKAGEVETLKSQVAALTEASQKLAARAEEAEANLKAARTEIETAKAAETTRARVAALTEKGAAAADAEALASTFASLSDEDFGKTVDVLAASWKKAPKSSETQVIDEAKAEVEAPLTVADASAAEQAEQSVAEVAEFFATNVLHTTKGRRGKAND